MSIPPRIVRGELTPEVPTKQRVGRIPRLRGRPFLQGRTLYRKTDANSKNITALRTQLAQLLKSKPGRLGMVMGDELSDPRAAPSFWVSKWVDFSEKYGFGYQLCDDVVGVMYKNTTELLMSPDGKKLQYIDKDGSVKYYTDENYPTVLEKRMKLLHQFRRYMADNLMKTGESIAPRECNALSSAPYLHSWYRTTSGVIMGLTNGTVQINFKDHTKLIMCPWMSAVTYHDKKENIRTYRFSSIEANGCSSDLACRLKYALVKISKIRPS